ncbi:hypothetical protein PQR53_37395 [Paraburkholderia fungorum]|uniref:hypothetical protein n=1 Tax=Paraburkholderia fungorum TaxID=134537 RepID=UPI0038BD6B53
MVENAIKLSPTEGHASLTIDRESIQEDEATSRDIDSLNDEMNVRWNLEAAVAKAQPERQ